MKSIFHIVIVSLFILPSSIILRAAEGDTTLLQLISNKRFPGNPSKMDTALVVPSKSWARIVLKLKLECPCGVLKGEWDYTNTYFIQVPNGKKDSITGQLLYDNIEIARFITPYWKYQPPTTSYTWQWDVTDYAFLMKDTTRFRVHYDGWSESALFSVWLEAIEGTAPYEVYALDRLWQQSFYYGRTTDPIDNHLLNKKFRTRDEAKFVKLRITNTGHGGYGSMGADEFVDKTHTIALNGTDRFTQHLWRDDCGSNPYYPQDGTWASQRAGWCPGDVVNYWDWDITNFVTKGDSTRLDYKMQPFVVDAACDGIYSINTQVLYAKQPNFNNDVSLEEILAPNSDAAKTRYNRMNPICGSPIVRLRNNGRSTATSVTLEYGIRGEAPLTYTWTGSIPMMESASVYLPAPDWTASFAAASRTFDCRVVKVNGSNDEYPLFNTLSSTYSVPPTYDSDIEVNFKTNLQANGQGYFWTVTDADGSIVAERQNNTMSDNTKYTDSLHLPLGCYEFRWVNPSSIGLDWWATQKQIGSATLSFTSHDLKIKSFPGDCGNGVSHQFIVALLPKLQVVDNVSLIQFGAPAIGDSVQKTVAIRAANAKGLTVSKVNIVTIAKGFSIVSTTPDISDGKSITLNGSEELSIVLQYKPQATSKKIATLNIESNDAFNSKYSISMIGGESVSDVEDDRSVTPHLCILPSSASESARILFSVDATQSTSARCALYNSLGQEIRVLFDNTIRPFSENEINSEVSDLSQGIYFVILHTGNIVITAPLIISR